MSNKNSNNSWSDSAPNFKVSFAIQDNTVSVQEILGLETETQVIEYRHSKSNEFSAIKMPGMKKNCNVILKKGIFRYNTIFWKWVNDIKMNSIQRETITIQLLDSKGSPIMTWTLENAWPTKISGIELQTDNNEITVETVELVHEGISIEKD